MARTFTLNFPSTAFFPGGLTLDGPTFKNHGAGAYNRVSLAFSSGVAENGVTGMFVMPAEYVGNSDTHHLKADICYFTNPTSGDADILCALEALADGASIDMQASQSFATPSTDTVTVPGTQGNPDIHTYNLTTEGAADSVDGGNIVRLGFARIGTNASDDLGGDLFLASISLYEETV
tara:strand:+ start:158 stop:691 length:534 start_codon:yes stop_codon:yes gene_type:complete